MYCLIPDLHEAPDPLAEKTQSRCSFVSRRDETNKRQSVQSFILLMLCAVRFYMLNRSRLSLSTLRCLFTIPSL